MAIYNPQNKLYNNLKQKVQKKSELLGLFNSTEILLDIQLKLHFPALQEAFCCL